MGFKINDEATLGKIRAAIIGPYTKLIIDALIAAYFNHEYLTVMRLAHETMIPEHEITSIICDLREKDVVRRVRGIT